MGERVIAVDANRLGCAHRRESTVHVKAHQGIAALASSGSPGSIPRRGSAKPDVNRFLSLTLRNPLVG